MGSEQNKTFEIISLDRTTNSAKMHYFNSKGESGLMTGEILNNDFNIDGDGIKFNGTINDDNSVIVGKWYLQTENNNWKEFIELKLKKQN